VISAEVSFRRREGAAPFQQTFLCMHGVGASPPPGKGRWRTTSNNATAGAPELARFPMDGLENLVNPANKRYASACLDASAPSVRVVNGLSSTG